MADPEDTTSLPALRPSIEAAIERLIAVLDDLLDDDPDLEEGGDIKPSLGWCDGARFAHAVGSTLDLEEEHDGRDPEIDEASLGSRDSMVDQTQWGAGSNRDEGADIDWSGEHSVQVADGAWNALKRPVPSLSDPQRCELDVAAMDEARERYRVRRDRNAALEAQTGAAVPPSRRTKLTVRRVVRP